MGIKKVAYRSYIEVYFLEKILLFLAIFRGFLRNLMFYDKYYLFSLNVRQNRYFLKGFQPKNVPKSQKIKFGISKILSSTPKITYLEPKLLAELRFDIPNLSPS